MERIQRFTKNFMFILTLFIFILFAIPCYHYKAILHPSIPKAVSEVLLPFKPPFVLFQLMRFLYPKILRFTSAFAYWKRSLKSGDKIV